MGGEDSAYDRAFQAARSMPTFTIIHSNNYDQLCEIWGALKGLHHALRAGLLQKLRRLLQADIFADLLKWPSTFSLEDTKMLQLSELAAC